MPETILTSETPVAAPSVRAKRLRVLLLCAMAALILVTAVLFVSLSRRERPVYVYSPNTKILLYHLVANETYGLNDYLFVKTDAFEAQLQAIEKSGAVSVFADELEAAGDKKCVVLTFDDGYESVYTNAFPLLKKYGIKATVFLISDTIGAEGYLTRTQIREMEASGLVRFGSHTKSHRMLTELNANAVRQELNSSRTELNLLLRRPVKAVAFPNGAYTEETLALVTECGYTYAYTTDTPSVPYYKNTQLPRYYVTREMTLDAFLEILRF